MLGGIEVEGLKPFRAALRTASSDLPKQLQKVNKAAAEIVASDARSRAAALGGVAAKTGPNIRAGATQTAGVVRIGSDRYPFALGAEFGGIRYRQFKPWRGNGMGAGYFLYPAIRASVPVLVQKYGNAIDDLARRAFPD